MPAKTDAMTHPDLLATRSPARERRIAELERRYPLFLLVTLLPILVLPSVDFGGSLLGRLTLPAVVDLLIIQSLRTLPYWEREGQRLKRDYVYQLLGILGVVLIWAPSIIGNHPLLPRFHGAVLLILSAFYVFTAVRIINVLAHAREVNAFTLCLGAAGYVHLGLTGGQLATTIQLLHPGSFNIGQVARGEELIERLTYFSFVTIGSLGYGDVLPSNGSGERFVVLLSLSSTLYVTLLIGLLLSRYINTQSQKLVEEVEQELESEREHRG